MATTPPGWYDDGHGALRWWDGSQWTEHVAQPDAETSDAPTEADIVAASTAKDDGAVPAAAGAAWTAPSGAPDGLTTAYGYGAAPQASSGPSALSAATYPGADAPVGAFSAATAPRKSKLWIVWLVLGIVLLGIVVAVAVLVPMLILGATAGPTSSPQPGSSAVEEPEAESEGADSADEAAAVDAVEVYNQSWLDSDCEAYFASTTENFRTLMELPDCETFYTQSRGYTSSISDFAMTVREVEAVGDAIAVSVTESYTSPYDADGNETPEPQRYDDRWEYFVVDEAGVWKIDDGFAD